VDAEDRRDRPRGNLGFSQCLQVACRGVVHACLSGLAPPGAPRLLLGWPTHSRPSCLMADQSSTTPTTHTVHQGVSRGRVLPHHARCTPEDRQDRPRVNLGFSQCLQVAVRSGCAPLVGLPGGGPCLSLRVGSARRTASAARPAIARSLRLAHRLCCSRLASTLAPPPCVWTTDTPGPTGVTTRGPDRMHSHASGPCVWMCMFDHA